MLVPDNVQLRLMSRGDGESGQWVQYFRCDEFGLGCIMRRSGLRTPIREEWYCDCIVDEYFADFKAMQKVLRHVDPVLVAAAHEMYPRFPGQLEPITQARSGHAVPRCSVMTNEPATHQVMLQTTWADVPLLPVYMGKKALARLKREGNARFIVDALSARAARPSPVDELFSKGQ